MSTRADLIEAAGGRVARLRRSEIGELVATVFVAIEQVRGSHYWWLVGSTKVAPIWVTASILPTRGAQMGEIEGVSPDDRQAPRREVSARSPKRRVPRGTVVTMVLSFLFMPAVAVGLPGTEWVTGFWLFLPAPLGFVGATWAVLSRSLSTDDRIGWALVSVSYGFVIIIVWFNLVLIIGGP